MALTLFFYFATVMISMAVLVVALRKPIYSALCLLVLFLHVAGLFVLLDAEFIAVVQIIVYAGAILVLYLFVVMLLNVRPDEGYHRQLLVGLTVGFALIVEAVLVLTRSGFAERPAGSEGLAALAPGAQPDAAAPAAVGNTEAIGQVLYTTYLIPFEVASLILLVAMIGAIIFSKKGIFDP